MRTKKCLAILFLLFFSIAGTVGVKACSILYYIDTKTGKIYVVNNEDYWYDTKAYIKIFPSNKKELARLWYGWDDFAQGGINEAGLFFDGAVTPEQPNIKGYSGPSGNLGDKILTNCKTVDEAVTYLEAGKIALSNAHMLLGDRTGNAVVVEWIGGRRILTTISKNYLMVTNYSLNDKEQGNYPCYRFQAMENEIERLEKSNVPITMREVGNVAAKAVQTPRELNGKTVGTLYSSFFNITDMEFILVYKLDNAKITKLNLRDEFEKGKKQTIRLK